MGCTDHVNNTCTDNIVQLDGNETVASTSTDDGLNISNVNVAQKHSNLRKYEIALNLPTVAAYNMRSLFPKIGNFKIDMLERAIDVAFVSEVWELSEKKEHALEVEKMLELDGLHYLSKSRPTSKRGGGVAIITNLEKFSIKRLDISTPSNLEVIWGLLKPKCGPCRYKNIIVCCFYSPPKSRKNSKLVDHLVGTLQMLNTKYPDSGIIMGADKNSMNIAPLLNCGLRLKQIVDQATINGKILDVLITNLSSFYNSPIIAPPIGPDDPEHAKPSDHSVPVSSPHTDRYNPPHRTWKLHTYRPLPDSRLREFGQWITQEEWGQLSNEMSATEQASMFENILKENLDKFCSRKTIKIGSQDKAWINLELKKIHRKKGREYVKRGKTEKYKALAREFKIKYEAPN